MNIWKEWWFFAAVFAAIYLMTDAAGLQGVSLLFLFAFGTIILLKGADILVENASELAAYYGVSSMIIGLTIVAFGTSVPELTVSVVSALKDVTDISIGNIVGSNIANIALILGLAATFSSIVIRKASLKFDTPFMVFSGIMLFVLAFNIGFDFNEYTYALGHIDGIILLALFAWFMTVIIRRAMRQRAAAKEDGEVRKGKPLRNLLFIVVGITGVVIGGNLLVDSSSEIARMMGVSEVVIGITIVAVGTSLPELVTSVVAAVKKQTDIAIGNIVGSNVFNTLWVLGLVGAIHPLPVRSTVLFIDIPIMIGFSILLWYFFMSKKQLARAEGLSLLGLYVLYIGFLSIRTFL